jgi:hypothetical protein
MKLYGTITSERATKGQGGNKYINFQITAGENKTIMLCGSITCEETETENIYRLFNAGVLVDTLTESKQSDDNCAKCGGIKDSYESLCYDCQMKSTKCWAQVGDDYCDNEATDGDYCEAHAKEFKGKKQKGEIVKLNDCPCGYTGGKVHTHE